MGASSRSSKRRKGDDDDSGDDHRRRNRSPSRSRSRSTSPKEKRSRRREKEASPSNADESESLSIEATNALRAKLGLAPLQTDDNQPKQRDAEDGSKIIVEDGMEFRHKKADNLADKKAAHEIQEKLETAKKKRQLADKMLRTKGLADSDDEDASSWAERMRQKEEERKRAEERAKMLDDMDEEFGVNSIIADEKSKQARTKARLMAKEKAKRAETGGLVIGHSKEAFSGTADQILVLDDKGVLDDGDEVLVNPNFLENEMHKKNTELRKRKDHKRGFDEDYDEYGNPINHGVLAKYDEDLEGVPKERFRLDESGKYDLGEVEREAQMHKQLAMAGKLLVSLETPKYKVASEFYTQDEMTAFRKPKKGKKEKSTRKRGKILKASDLKPIEDEPSEANMGTRRPRRRHEDDEDEEEGKASGEEDIKEKDVINTKGNDDEIEVDGKWKKQTQAAVNLEKLKKFAKNESDEEDSDDEMNGGMDLAGVILDDDAEDELTSVLDKARKLKQTTAKAENDNDGAARRVHDMITAQSIKMEVDDEEEEVQNGKAKDNIMCIDSTMEYCRNIGEIPTYGLAGNRVDAIDVSGLAKNTITKAEPVEDEIDEGLARWKQEQISKEKRRRDRVKRKEAKGGWLEAGPSNGQLDSDDEKELEDAKYVQRDSDSEEEEEQRDEYVNVLGKEADVTKGVGAMLKLAAQKGYLNDPDAKKQTGQNLDHLKNQSKTQIEVGKQDIEDKYAKKLDRLGTTGRGPIQSFPEKKDYNPEVTLQYVDEKGREMDQKAAYRELSYKFHGRNPGKKQTEKRIAQRDKKEMLKQMNSSDTPLGTLTKQLKKQEQLQTPYLLLSGSGRNDHTSIKKE